MHECTCWEMPSMVRCSSVALLPLITLTTHDPEQSSAIITTEVFTLWPLYSTHGYALPLLRVLRRRQFNCAEDMAEYWSNAPVLQLLRNTEM